MRLPSVGLVVLLVTITFVGCFLQKKTGGGGDDDDDGEDDSLPARIVADDGNVLTAAIDTGGDRPVKLSGSSGSTVSAANVVFPPGSLAAVTEVTIEEGTSLATTDVAAELGAEGSPTFTPAGPTVVITPKEPIDAIQNFAISLPITSIALAQDDQLSNLVVLYKFFLASEGNRLVVGLVPRGTLTVADGLVKFQTTHFGAFQAVFSDAVITEPIQKTAKAPFVKKRDEQQPDPGTFTITGPSGPFYTNKIRVSWTNSENVAHYRLFVSRESDCSNDYQDHGRLTDTSKALDPLEDGPNFICVFAFNAVGERVGAENQPFEIIRGWRKTATDGAPSARAHHTLIWHEKHAIVWGGECGDKIYCSDGAKYDPVGNNWSDLSGSDAPSARGKHASALASKSGKMVILIWGGVSTNDTPLADGGIYDIAGDEWSTMSRTNSPDGRFEHGSAIAGDYFVVWGGIGDVGGNLGLIEDGGLYDIEGDSWMPIAAPTFAIGVRGMAMTGIGDIAVIIGGKDADGDITGVRAIYDPMSGFTEIDQTIGAPTASEKPITIPVGENVLYAGSPDNSTELEVVKYFPNDGSSGIWSPFTTEGGPEGREGFTFVNTDDKRAIVWAGTINETNLPKSDVFVLDTSKNSWLAHKAEYQMPAQGHLRKGVWTGRAVFVFGGQATASEFLADGALYYP